jgi:hypothetical protein
VTLTQEQLNQLLAAAAGGNGGGINADALAKAFAKAQRPENTTTPEVSTYNPRGERDHPRPALVAGRVTQNGVILDRDTLTWEEIEAINALTPGEFRIAKSNGSKITMTVAHVRGLDGVKLERLEMHWPCKGDDHRYDHRSLFDYCVDAVEGSGRTDEAERLRALKRQLDRERDAA